MASVNKYLSADEAARVSDDQTVVSNGQVLNILFRGQIDQELMSEDGAYTLDQVRYSLSYNPRSQCQPPSYKPNTDTSNFLHLSLAAHLN
jgi:hypothetical protein